MRLIDADALLENVQRNETALRNELIVSAHNREIYNNSLIRLNEVLSFEHKIKYAPTVERPRGEWIKPTVINGKAFSICHCSACGGVPCGVDENTKFCPNCGADMRGEGE
jgi:hypothetical protein